MPDPSASHDAHAFELIAALCDLSGPCGHERPVARELCTRWKALGVDVQLDAVGNVLGHVGGDGPRVLIQAHMDEIGFVVRHITDDGFLLLDSAQEGRRRTHERRYMVGQPALALGRGGSGVPGVFAAPSGHVLTREQIERPALSVADFFVDVGAESRADALERGVHVGAPVVWDVKTRRLGRRVVGKAMDDRVMLSVITLLLERIEQRQLPIDLWVAGTVQEENLFHGAKALAGRERFDEVIALDVGLAGDIPAVAPGETATELAHGPVVVHQDMWVAYDQALAWELVDAGAAAGTPVQQAAYANYGSDGVAFIDAGSPAALLGVPVRYTHTAIETIDVADVHAAVRLLEQFLQRTHAGRAAGGAR